MPLTLYVDIMGNTYTGIPRDVADWVPDYCSKVSSAIKLVVIFLLVEVLALDL